MSVVEVSLQGRCVDRRSQEALAADMRQLENFGSSQLAAGEQGRGIAYPGVEIHPTVIISAAVFEGERAPSHLKKIDGTVYLAEDAALFGHELSLAEPITLKTHSKEMTNGTLGFVFLRSRDTFLDGRLVYPCGTNPQHPYARLSAWVLEPPSILLTDGLGAWGAEFLGWVSQAYIPDLRIWMGEEESIKESLEASSWRKWVDKESQFAALREAYQVLTGVGGERTEEIWETESLFKDKQRKEIG